MNTPSCWIDVLHLTSGFLISKSCMRPSRVCRLFCSQNDDLIAHVLVWADGCPEPSAPARYISTCVYLIVSFSVTPHFAVLKFKKAEDDFMFVGIVRSQNSEGHRACLPLSSDHFECCQKECPNCLSDFESSLLVLRVLDLLRSPA